LKLRSTAQQIEEPSMSKVCGDTARAHRQRKQRIAHREKVRILRAQIAERAAAKTAEAPKK
jgi:hypothetical protein